MKKLYSIISSLFLSLPLLSLAHTGEEEEGFGHMMSDWGFNGGMMNGGWMWIWMILGWIIAVLLIVLLVVLIIKLINK